MVRGLLTGDGVVADDIGRDLRRFHAVQQAQSTLPRTIYIGPKSSVVSDNLRLHGFPWEIGRSAYYFKKIDLCLGSYGLWAHKS